MINVYAELVAIKGRVERLESLLGLSRTRPRKSGVVTSPAGERFRAGKRLWSKADDALLRQRYPHESTQHLAAELLRTVSATLGRAGKLGLKKTPEYCASLAAASRLSEAGAPFRFPKGNVPANKGTRRPGWAPGRMAETQFKKGQPPLNYMPVDSTRVIDGYLYRKVSDTRNVPWTRNWALEHVRVWEAANGPLPPGHAIAFRNGDRTDIRLDNLECITRRELMARNSIHNLPEDLRKTIQLLGVLNRQINKREKPA
ncbi:MAG: HNH endonuclease signature motif containing protein [Thermoanaerobaculia bacterium]